MKIKIALGIFVILSVISSTLAIYFFLQWHTQTEINKRSPIVSFHSALPTPTLTPGISPTVTPTPGRGVLQYAPTSTLTPIQSGQTTPPTPTAKQAISASSTPTITPPSPTPKPISLSGKISLSGATPLNSRIVIFQKLLNTANYQVAVDNISLADGVGWRWDAAKNATWYTMIAILKQRQSDGTDKDIASSQPVDVASPAENISLSIASGYTLPAPTGSITVNCQTYNGGPNQNTWNVAVSFDSVNGAGSYWYELGTTDGGNDVNNSAGTTATISAVFNNNTTYYARYAYTAATVAQPGNSQYSSFSSTTKLECSH